MLQGYSNFIYLIQYITIIQYLFSVANITELRSSSVQQRRITYSWTISGPFDKQKVSFTKVGGDGLFKTITSSIKRTFTETAVPLEPCTVYEISVTVFKNCKSSKRSIFVTTYPECKFSFVGLLLDILILEVSYLNCIGSQDPGSLCVTT